MGSRRCAWSDVVGKRTAVFGRRRAFARSVRRTPRLAAPLSRRAYPSNEHARARGYPRLAMKVSIVTVTLNSAATLATAMESVRRQDHPDIEHILVDGNSSDHTLDIIRSYPHVAQFIS